MDPPVHTAHRSLLMSLITPRRLKENEEFMWKLADQQIDTFISNGECEFMDAFAQPFAVLVVSDLLGVPPEDRTEFRKHLIRVEQESGGAVVGGTDGEVTHGPLIFLYDKFSAYIEDRRRNPRADVLTGLAQATFPDGWVYRSRSMSPGLPPTCSPPGRKPRCGCSATLSNSIGEHPDIQQRLREDRSLIPNFVEECLRTEGPVKGDFRLAKKPTNVGGVDIPAGTFLFIANGAANRDARKFENPAEFQLGRSRTPGCMWHSAPAAMPAPVPPWRGRKRSSPSTACSTAPATFVSRRKSTGRPARGATAICQPSSCAD